MRHHLLYGLFLCGLCLLAHLGVLSKPALALSLEQVLQNLDQNYPPLQAARQKLMAVQGKLQQKQGAFDTKIKAKGSSIPAGYYRQIILDGLVEQTTPLWGLSFYGGYRLGVGDFAVYDGKKATHSLGEIRTGFQLPLLRNGPIDENRLALALAELDLERARLEVFEKQLKFIKEASKYYWSWVAASRKAQLAKELLELAQKRNRDLEQSIALGQLPPIILTENQTALFKRQAKWIEARQKQQQAAWALSLFLQRQDSGQLQLPISSDTSPDFPTPPEVNEAYLLKTLPQALQMRPEPQVLQIQLEQNQLNKLWAENQGQPELNLNLGLSQDIGQGDKSRDPLELEVGLNFEWPVQLRKAQGLLNQLHAERQQLELELRFSQEQIGVEIQSLVTALLAAQERIKLARQQVRVAQELETAERNRFELGATTLLILNLREQARGDAVNEEIEALETWFKTQAEYLAALGLLRSSALPLL